MKTHKPFSTCSFCNCEFSENSCRYHKAAGDLLTAAKLALSRLRATGSIDCIDCVEILEAAIKKGERT